MAGAAAAAAAAAAATHRFRERRSAAPFGERSPVDLVVKITSHPYVPSTVHETFVGDLYRDGHRIKANVEYEIVAIFPLLRSGFQHIQVRASDEDLASDIKFYSETEGRLTPPS